MSGYSQESFPVKISPLAFNDDGSIDPIFTSLLVSYNILNVSDVFLTRKIIYNGGNEENPLMRSIVKNPPYDLVFKSLIMMGENWGLKWLKQENALLGYTAAVLLNVIYSYVNYNNNQVVIRLNTNI